MRRLILIRHAKSDWSLPGRPDHARTLNPRGRRAASALGRWMAQEQLIPDTILCSDAQRTRQTWSAIAAELEGVPDPELRADLYHATPDAMLDAIAASEARVLAVVGHNPGIAQLAGRLADPCPDHPKFSQYPTGATLVVDFDDAHWPSALAAPGRLVQFVVPRELPAASAPRSG